MSPLQILKQIDEAKKELDHIRRALQRMEQICRGYSDSILSQQQLACEQTTLNGWVVSLLETDISMCEIISPSRNPLAKTAVLAEVQRVLHRPKVLGLQL